MNFSLLTFLFIMVLCVEKLSGGSRKKNDCPNIKTTLGSIRKRRHLVFPDSTNFVSTISVAKAFMTHAPSGWNTVVEIDVLTPLPDKNFTNAHYRRKLHHRQKREVWESISNTLSKHNFDGKECLQRTICEAKQYLAPKGRSLVHDILRALFRAELDDKGFQEEIKGSYNEFLRPNICDSPSNCPVSILEILLNFNK